MCEQNDDFAQLLAIVNQEEEEVEEITEEELQQALNSPTLHQNAMECDEESTECDEYENSDGFKFDNNNNNNNNINSNDSNDNTIKETDKKSSSGDTCKKRAEYQFQMMDHHIFKGKHGKKLYKCDVCYAVYRHSFSLKRHFIRSHINYGYLCETDVTNCGINLASSASLQTWNTQNSDNHLDKSDVDLPELYCCHSCVLFYDELSQIKSHVDDCHRNTKSGSIEPIRIPCSECNMSFIQRHNLMRHIEVVHNGRKLYGCKHCSKKFQTIADRKKHEKSQHQVKHQQSEPSTTTNKTHSCIRCSDVFYTYSDLRKHCVKKHKDYYNPCGFCTKFMFSKKQLNEHLRQKHVKTSKDNTEKLKLKKRLPSGMESRAEELAAKPTAMTSNSISSQNTHQAYFHCSLCYRRFLTYGSLIRHKQIAHRPQVRHCSRLTAQTHVDPEIIEPFNNANEIEFYRTLAQRVAENLLYFVDGKFVNCHNSSDTEVIPFAKRNVGIKDGIRDGIRDGIKERIESELNLVKYNFPENYKYSSPSPLNTEKLEFLLDCNLNTVPTTKIDYISPSHETTPQITHSSSKPMFICSACHEKISPELFADHEANNHPNIDCTYIEVDSLPNIPSQLLLWQYHCADGLLHRCPVAPTLTRAQTDSNISMKCTKCTKSFASVSLLHNHILECAHNNGSKDKSVNNKNHNNNNNGITSVTAISTTISPSINTNSTVNNSYNTDNDNNNNNLISADVEKALDFSSPLSPCKTRSGKRRQISPEDVKIKKSKISPKSSETVSKQIRKDSNIVNTNESKAQVINDNNVDNQRVEKELISEEKVSKNDSKTNSNEVSSEENWTKCNENVPKRYTCKKCSKKFVYMDSLQKHNMSCKRVFNAKQTAKHKLKKITQNQKLVLKIEIKAIKNIHKNQEKKKRVYKQTKLLNTNKKLATSVHLNEETQPLDKDIESNTDNNDSSSTTLPESTSKQETSPDSSTTKDMPQNASPTLDTPNTSLQEHRCPDCLRVFTYTANFRKHIRNVCPVRKQLGSDAPSANSSPMSSTPLKSISETSVTDVTNIVIKQEKPEMDETLNANNTDVSADEEVVYEGENPVEENTEEDEDVVDISMSSKDDSKLDLWRVKQENPMFAFKGSPAQHHSCPYCQRGFTYLANYRKHIKSICPIRQQIEEKKKQVIEDNNEQEVNGVKVKSEVSIPTVVYTPSSLSVRTQIEDTVLTLLRDQTKQDQILQSSEELVKSKSSEDSTLTSTNEMTANNTNNKNSIESEISDDLKSSENDKSKDKKKEASSPSGKGSSYRFRTFSCSICHKIFLSYVTMLKHRLSHKLSDGSANEDNNNTNTNTNDSITSTTNENNNQLIQVNQDKEIQNQALAASLLKRSKETIFCKMRGNTVSTNSSIKVNKPVINTTELLEKLARGGISSESLQLNKSKENGPELMAETNGSTNSYNASTSNSSTSNNSNNTNNNNLPEIIIDTNNLNDLELGVLKDGVIVQDLQQLIVNESDKLPVNEVLLDIDPNDIGSANELWITFTDSSAFVQVPQNNNNNNNKANND